MATERAERTPSGRHHRAWAWSRRSGTITSPRGTSLVAGESGAGPITRFDPSEYAVRFACELKDYDPTTWIDRKQARRMDVFSQFALSAARMAEADSGIVIAASPTASARPVATGIGGLTAFEDCVRRLIDRGPDRTCPLSIVQIIPNMAAAWVSMELGAQGPLAAECTACAASNMAIGDGLDAIRLGRAEVMFCGGTEAPVTHVGIAGFSAMRALSQRNDDPKAGSRPFDSGRDGFVMGEAAGGGRPRGARSRARPWREDLRRATRLRRLLRRDPRDGARSERRRIRRAR